MPKSLRFQPSPGDVPAPLYRYMEKEFVDRFFSDGELFLTSFNRCKEHEDKARRDQREGRYIFEFRGKSNTLAVNHQAGANSYMLCTSVSSDHNLLSRFKADSRIKISQPTEFFLEIAKAIPGLVNSRYGF